MVQLEYKYIYKYNLHNIIGTFFYNIMINSSNNLVQIYKGGLYNLKRDNSMQKAIVFDLDETLGDFTHLYTLWQGIKEFIIKSDVNVQDIFNQLLDLYPEFLRCGITNVLNYIKLKKERKKLKNLFIYTNNKCMDNEWIKNISSYFDYKLETLHLFDKAICAFKIDNKIIDIKSKHKKNINYLINCTMIPKNTEICFIDNSFYNGMLNHRIYYIQPMNYNHNVNTVEIIKRFMNSYIGNYIIAHSNINIQYKSFLTDWFHINSINNKPRIIVSKNDCIEMTKKILFHIKEFFYISTMKTNTKKKYKTISNFTRKIIK